MSSRVGQKLSSDLVFLRLWRRPAAIAPIQPLSWELPYTTGAALKKKKKKPTITNSDKDVLERGLFGTCW